MEARERLEGHKADMPQQLYTEISFNFFDTPDRSAFCDKSRARKLAEVDEDGLCTFCAGIPWDDLANPLVAVPDTLPSIRATTREMQDSDCRVCQFLCTVIESRRGSTQETQLIPYWLHLGETFLIGKRNIGTASIAGLPDPDNGHLLVVQEPNSRTLTQPDTLMRGNLPMDC
jgi:hypothetical protein